MVRWRQQTATSFIAEKDRERRKTKEAVVKQQENIFVSWLRIQRNSLTGQCNNNNSKFIIILVGYLCVEYKI